MADIDHTIYPSELRMKFSKQGDKEAYKGYLKLEFHVNRLAHQIFRQAFVREHDLNAAIFAVYLSGLYHGSELERKPDASD